MNSGPLGWDPEQLRILEQQITCPDCKAPMELRQGKSNLYYGCKNFSSEPRCFTTHRAYQEGELVGRPIGRPAPKAVRSLRKEVYELAGQRWNLQDGRARVEFKTWTARRLKIRSAVSALTLLNETQLTAIRAALEREIQEISGQAGMGQ